MKKVFLLAIVFLFLSVFESTAQKKDAVIEHVSDSMVWKNKKLLNISGNEGKPANEFVFTCSVYLPKDSLKVRNKLYHASHVKVGFNYRRFEDLGLDPSQEDLQYLYSQTIINIYQYYSNVLRHSMYEIRFKPGYYGLFDNAFQEVYNEMLSVTTQFKEETDSGKNEEKLKEWNNRVSKNLESYQSKK